MPSSPFTSDLNHALCMTPPPAFYPMTKMEKEQWAHDDLNCLTCSATHIWAIGVWK